MMDLRIPIQEVKYDGKYGNAEFRMMRLDLLNAPVADNKFFKLKWMFNEASAGARSLVSCGGPYSNHLLALAIMAEHYGCRSIGYVRGTHFKSNPILDLCKSHGMDIVQVESSGFSPSVLATRALEEYQDAEWVPMGGTSLDAMKSVADLTAFIPEDVGDVHIPVGTGGTAGGLVMNWSGDVVGYEVVRAGSWRDSEVANEVISGLNNITWVNDKQWTRFGHVNRELLDFARDWFARTGVPLDMNYNIKMIQSIVNQEVKLDSSLVINTGGIQGNLGHEALLGENIYPSFSKQSC